MPDGNRQRSHFSSRVELAKLRSNSQHSHLAAPICICAIDSTLFTLYALISAFFPPVDFLALAFAGFAVAGGSVNCTAALATSVRELRGAATGPCLGAEAAMGLAACGGEVRPGCVGEVRPGTTFGGGAIA